MMKIANMRHKASGELASKWLLLFSDVLRMRFSITLLALVISGVGCSKKNCCITISEKPGITTGGGVGGSRFPASNEQQISTATNGVEISNNAGPYRYEWDLNGHSESMEIAEAPLQLGGTEWSIFATRAGFADLYGSIHSAEGYSPFCLVEFRTNSQKLPKEMRNHWLLGVGFVGKYQSIKRSMPITCWLNYEAAAASENGVVVEMVMWSNDHNTLDGGRGHILEDAGAVAEFRSAQRTMILKNRIVNGKRDEQERSN